MKILIAGGTGYLGQHLTRFLLTKGHTLTVLGRSEGRIKWLFKDHPDVQAISWAGLLEEANPLAPYDIVINLCGESIGEGIWTTKRKQDLIDSRVKPTRTLADLCRKAGNEAPRLFNASAIGIYGLQKPQKDGLPQAFTEESPIKPAPDFLSAIGREWELASAEAAAAGVPVVLLRFGVVLSYDGGVLKRLKLPYLLGMGGRISHGYQPFTWVSMPDFLNAIAFLIEHSEITGPVNIVAPEGLTQRAFSKALGRALHRPTFMITPRWFVRKMFKQMGDELLLQGQNVAPKRLLEHGYAFINPTIDQALQKVVHST